MCAPNGKCGARLTLFDVPGCTCICAAYPSSFGSRAKCLQGLQQNQEESGRGKEGPAARAWLWSKRWQGLKRKTGAYPAQQPLP